MFIRALVIFVAIVSPCAVAAPITADLYDVMSLGSGPIRVLKAEVKGTRNSPSGFPRPLWIFLRGPETVGAITITPPHEYLALAHLQFVNSACAVGKPIQDGEFIEVSSDWRTLADYLGSKAKQYDRFWVIADKTICAENYLREKDFTRYRFYVCGARASETVCARELLRANFSVNYSVHSSDVAELTTAEQKVAEYVMRTVVVVSDAH